MQETSPVATESPITQVHGYQVENVDQAFTVVLRALMQDLGDEPTREGLKATPSRYLHAMRELTSGYTQDPRAHLEVIFSEQCDEMIVVQDIPFYSLCEHHLLPFYGHVTFAYIPQNNRIVGLSKIPRLVNCFARRFQVQERMTQQIADTFWNALEPVGVGVIARAQHTCMIMRGIQSQGWMTSSCLKGAIREDARARDEFMLLGSRWNT